MSRCSLFAVPLLLVSLFGISAAFAQNSTGKLIWQPFVGLVGYWQVSEELNLTPRQIDRIRKIGSDYEDEISSAMKDNKLSGEERRKALSELSRTLEARVVKDTKATLTEKQAARLRQMEIWNAGPLAFTDPDIVKDLKLTGQQVATLTTIGNEYLNKLRDPRSNPPRGRPGTGGPSKEDLAKAREFRDGLHTTSLAECLEVLTEDQRTRFHKIKGPKFELDADWKPKP